MLGPTSDNVCDVECVSSFENERALERAGRKWVRASGQAQGQVNEGERALKDEAETVKKFAEEREIGPERAYAKEPEWASGQPLALG